MNEAPEQEDLPIQVREEILRLAVAGGFVDSVLAAGSELERVKHYLRILLGDVAPPPAPTGQAPVVFPPFPGLEERPWRDPPPAAASALEQHVDAVRNDLARLESSPLLHYRTDIVGTGRWTVHPIYFAGERVDRLFWPELAMDSTARVVRSLTGECTDLPLGDVMFSAHAPATRAVPSFGWDGFRMRLHLGLRAPEGSAIRVGTEARAWRTDRVLAFHDSFEHETTNPSNERRVVLIADCWHPDLTEPEREALLALTRKLEVRALLAQLRLPENLVPPLLARFEEVERADRWVWRYWRR
ncbi:aspartyl/asparaginyl beta-hydroxylase domain-containing protein [Myxococcaceae bacterium JPH2]|nr:aspartyl/asparaginyl beta-hydroxylase domain-containing protein [Myxococcaceae bacterium JPH2]